MSDATDNRIYRQVNPHEADARDVKCKKLALSILAEAIEVVRHADEETWRAMAKRAGVNMPSPTSQARVIELLEKIG